MILCCYSLTVSAILLPPNPKYVYSICAYISGNLLGESEYIRGIRASEYFDRHPVKKVGTYKTKKRKYKIDEDKN